MPCRSTSCRARIAIAAAALCAGYAYRADSATFNISWDGGSTGNWNTAVNWSTNVVPNNVDVLSDYYNVTINRTGGAIVTGNLAQIDLLNLTIGATAGNQLTLADNCTFGVIGTALFGPATITNSGTISLGTTVAAASQFDFLGSTTNLTGGGTVVMGFLGVSLDGSGTVTSDNTIIGQGSFGLDNIAFINNGTVSASGGTLTVDVSTGGFDNNGLMQALAGGTLVLSGNGGGTWSNGTGSIINNGGRVNLISGATISGGTISTLNLTGSSIFFIPGGNTATISGVTSTADVNVGIASTLNLVGAITNNGRFRANSGAGVATFNIGSGTVTLGGTGSLSLAALSATTGNLVGSGTLVTGVSQSVFGAGTLGDGSTTIRNNGTIESNISGAMLFIRPETAGVGMVNNGTVRSGAGSIAIASSTITNTGTFDVQNTLTTSGAGNVTINGGTLDVGPSGQVNPGSGSTLVFNGMTIINSGAMQDTPSGSITFTGNNTVTNTGGMFTIGSTRMRVDSGTTTFTGSSNLSLSNSTSFLTGTGTINNSGHTILGSGTIGEGNLAILNSGTIAANLAATTLTITLGPADLTNTGTLEARTGATLNLADLGGGIVSNAGGTLSANGGTINLLNGTTVLGGTWVTPSSGHIRIPSGGTVSAGAFTNQGRVTVEGGGTLLVNNITPNNGSINVNGAVSSATLNSESATTTFNGTGTLHLISNSGTAVVGGSGTLVNGALHTISGEGQLGNNTLAIINNGTITAAGDVTTAPGLIIDPGLGGLANTGTITDSTTALLIFQPGQYNNIGGQIISRSTANAVRLNGGTFTGGTFSSSGGGDGFQLIPGATVTMTDIANATTIAFSSNAALTINGTINNTGTLFVGSGNPIGGDLVVGGGTVTLAGNGQVLMNAVLIDVADVLGSGTLVNSGNHIHGAGRLGNNAIAMHNAATISADVSGATLTIDPISGGNFTNTGTLQATGGGSLVLTGNGGGFFSNTGTISAAGGNVTLTGAVNVSAGTLRSNPGNAIQVASGQQGGIAGATNIGDITNTDGTLTLNSFVTNNGTISVGGGANAATVSLTGVGATLSGTGRMVLGVAGTGAVTVNGVGTLTNGASHRIEGRGQLGANVLAIVNNGTINANNTSLSMLIDPSPAGMINNGTLLASPNSLMVLSGNGGGSFDNSAGTISAQAVNGDVLLQDGVVIQGGTIATPAANATVSVQFGDGATINNATNLGRILVQNGGSLTINNAITNNGTIAVSSGGSFTQLRMVGTSTVTLDGTGTVLLSGANPFLAPIGTLVNNGNLISGRGNISGGSLINQPAGIIDANASGQTLKLGPGSFSQYENAGLMRATGGGVLWLEQSLFTGGFVNTGAGTMLADNGSSIRIAGSVSGGTISTLGTGTIDMSFLASLSNVALTGHVVANTGSLTIGSLVTSSGLWDGDADGTIILSNAVVSSFTNSGTMNLVSSGFSPVRFDGAGAIANSGTMTGEMRFTPLVAGSFSMNNSGLITGSVGFSTFGETTRTMSMVNTGTLQAGVGSLLESGVLVTISGNGTIDVRNTGTFNNSGTVSAGNTVIDGTAVNVGTASLGKVSGAGSYQNGAFIFTGTFSGSTTATHLRVASVNNFAGSITTSAGGGTLGTSKVSSLTMNTGTKWDLTDHDLVIDYTGASQLLTIQGLLTTGYNGGAWTGNGLTSSSAAASPSSSRTALGYVEATDLFFSFPAIFSGQQVDSTSVLVKYTLSGDATLDGTVNSADFNLLASNFGTSGTRWRFGDFTFDGFVNSADFNALATNFGQTLAAGGTGPGAAVPEPGAATAAGLAALLLMRRRRAMHRQ